MDHTCRGVCGTVSEGSCCEFWLPWSPCWHNLPLCCRCVRHFAVMTTLLGRGGLRSFHRWRRFHVHTVYVIHKPPPHWIAMCVQWSQYSVHHFDWERDSEVQVLITDLWAYFSQCCPEKLIICTSREVLECWTHLHYFSPIPYWAADWEELNVFLPSLSPLTDKLVNCMCGTVLSVWMNMPEVEVVLIYVFYIHSVPQQQAMKCFYSCIVVVTLCCCCSVQRLFGVVSMDSPAMNFTLCMSS